MTPSTPIVGGGGGETPNYVKNYLYYPNDMCQLGFEKSELFKS